MEVDEQKLALEEAPDGEDPVAGPEEPPVEEPAPEPEKPGRLLSLDAFRGFTIFGMLLVNNVALGAETPKQLLHAHWNAGIHFADLVFPWFLFIVGVAIPFASAARRAKGLPRWSYYVKALGRALTLVFLGCLIDSSLAKTPVFDLNVLQLIGLAYFVGVLLYELPLQARLPVAALLLIGHWAALRLVNVPGIGAGSFTETENLVAHVNQTYLARYHLNGLVSVIPTAALVLIGTAVGDTLRRQNMPGGRRTLWILGGGAVMCLIGWLWSLDLPFNKPVWTASYIVFTAGLGSLVLGCAFWLIDVRGWRWWAYPMVVFGSNAIVAYVAPILVKIFILREWTWTMPDGTKLPLDQTLLRAASDQWGRTTGGWVYTLGYIFFWWLVVWVLYRKRLFLRV